jgi:hypothetical protein
LAIDLGFKANLIIKTALHYFIDIKQRGFQSKREIEEQKKPSEIVSEGLFI